VTLGGAAMKVSDEGGCTGFGGPYVLNQPSISAPAAKLASSATGTPPRKRRLVI
jgi:hypothetical protein